MIFKLLEINEKKKFIMKKKMMQEMNWATAQIILQEFNYIAIGGRLINLRKCIAVG